ncbi:MAG: pyridoxamine 5'-phosphate oxidase family protein [candidate division WOR-3 bacterium]|nr:MAG: pyridoxamine 5'-phosphate oxidase family protein [candidate division WOR-3 bacterium]
MGGIEDIKKEVWSCFKDMQVIYLATVDGDVPRVRPVTLIHYDKKMWITTGSDNNKIKQIMANNKIEFCLLLKAEETSGYIRGTGTAEVITDVKTRTLIAENTPFFKEFWKDTNDPGYALLRIHPRDIEYLKPGAMQVERFSVV